ncbi:MAG: exodeoxyribonuclease VII large subunit [Thermodesulfobacteriota bacterium]
MDPLNNRQTVLTVSQLTRSLKSLLENRFNFVRIAGEISNLKRPFSGHSYFVLKDNQAQLRSVLFKGQLRYLERDIKDGQKVICHGRITVYEPRGDYQLIVDTVTFEGTGELQQRFEELKNRLKADGLFDTDKKKQLPPFARRIAVITSPTGAAIHDFLKIHRSRGSTTDIEIHPVRVQGSGAEQEIAEAIRQVNRRGKADIIVLCRGGGSLEDLWAFNEEVTARAIADSRLPIVSAIGHEIDFTIADFCSDLRAATPTDAAEILLADSFELRRKVLRLEKSLSRSMLNQLDHAGYRLQQSRRMLGDMAGTITHYSLRVDHLAARLGRSLSHRLQSAEQRCRHLKDKLYLHSPRQQIIMRQQRLDHCSAILRQEIRSLLERKTDRLAAAGSLLDAVSPLATLGRGYSITRKPSSKTKTGGVITDSTQVRPGDRVEVLLRRGSIDCRIEKCCYENNSNDKQSLNNEESS